jgi:soluble lytic murein transglycosylase-like protein
MTIKIPEKITRWRPLIDKWCAQLKVSQALVMAVMQMESGGNPGAVRYEPLYEKRYITDNPMWLQRCKEGGYTTRDVASSYGLMQLMFPTAWGFGARAPKELYEPNQNIRYGTALIASHLKKYTIQETLAAYNGGEGAVKALRQGKDTAATRYSQKVMSLYQRYKEVNGTSKNIPSA